MQAAPANDGRDGAPATNLGLHHRVSSLEQVGLLVIDCFTELQLQGFAEG